MQLLVDLGNSAVKYCTFAGGELLNPQRELYKDRPDDELFANLPDTTADIKSGTTIKSAWISSVATAKSYDQIKQGLDAFEIPVIHQLQSQIEQNGIRNAYSQASQLGVDRWMSLLAIKSIGLPSAIIVSCGTAITIDVLDEDGLHQGGFISAGLGLQLQALSSTALPQMKQANIDAISSGFKLASDTENAVISGTLYSIVSWIHRVVVESCNKNNNNIPRVITGGDAPLLLPYLSAQSQWRHEPNLVLRGVATIAGGS